MGLRLLRFASPALAVFAFTTLCQAAVQDRIARIAEGSRVQLPHSVLARAKAAADLGVASPETRLDSVTLRFNMTVAQQAALTQLLADQQNEASPRYHQWLTPEQFGAQFGLSAADYSKITAWLSGKGLTVSQTSRSRTFISVSGTAGQMQQALGVEIHNLSINGEKHISNLSNPILPAAVAQVTAGITGLNDFRLKPRARAHTVKGPSVNPQFTSSISGNHYLAPGDFYTIYDLIPLISSSVNGSGITVAVMGQTDISLTDVAAFRTASGLSSNPPTIKTVGVDPGTLSSDIDEAQLDVEWSGAVAPSASILYVNSSNVIDTSLTYAVDNNVAPILSISYGDCEQNFNVADSQGGGTYLDVYNRLLQQANAQGQTVVAPAGDSGATDCDYSTGSAVLGLAVDYPASSPYATAAGGTMFNDGTGTGATSYWSASNNANAGSAISYIPETTWNETSSSVSGGGALAAGGGGASAYFAKPAWQVTGLANDFARDTPDISLNAASGHDGYLFCSQGSCVTGFRGSDGQTLDVVGGTSAATPAFAGILALLEQHLNSRVGNANPVLYALGNSTYSNNVFHDITSGDNKSPCTAGSVDCPTGGSIGFTAGPGYDETTGWGSVDAYNLVQKWSLVTPEGVGTTGTHLSAVSVSTSSAACGVQSSPLAVTINVSSADSSTATPTGSVQILVDGTVVGSPLTLTSGSASYSFATAGLSSGSHTLTAVYTGDGNYAGSKNSLSTDVVSSTQADFAMTPCKSTLTVPSGGTSSPITLSLTSVNGFAGSVAFTATSDDPTLAASYIFSVTPLTLTSGGTSTTSFTLAAYQTHSKTGTGLIRTMPGQQSQNRMPWYSYGSGVTVAGLLMLSVPRRRRWTMSLVVICTAGIFAVAGCGAGNTLQNTGGGGTTTTTTNAAPGTYNIRIAASSSTSAGAVVHVTNVSLTIQ